VAPASLFWVSVHWIYWMCVCWKVHMSCYRRCNLWGCSTCGGQDLALRPGNSVAYLRRLRDTLEFVNTIDYEPETRGSHGYVHAYGNPHAGWPHQAYRGRRRGVEFLQPLRDSKNLKWSLPAYSVCKMRSGVELVSLRDAARTPR